MDTVTLGYVVATVGSIGGAGMVTAGGIGKELGLAAFGTEASGGGGGGTPGPDQALPRLPWWLRCPICPIVFGVAMAVLLWGAAEPTPQPAMVLIAASLVGLAAGSGGATAYRAVGSTFF